MKKYLLILTSFLVLSGCSQGNVVQPEPSAPSETAEVEPPQATAETVELTDNPIAKPDEAMKYLNGNWVLRTNDPETNMAVTLEFDEASGTVKVTNLDDDYITASVQLFSSYPDNTATTDDALRFEATEASEAYKEKFGTNLSVYSSDMQWFTGSSSGQDYLFLRELGNGQSVLDYELLGDAKMTGDMGWVFTRDNFTAFPTSDENELLKRKNDTYYAYCWMRNGNSVLLQEMDTFETDENWYGEPLKTMRITYTDGAYSNIICLYSDGDDLNTFKPGLVRVTVDAEGKITAMEDISYMGYGAYAGE